MRIDVESIAPELADIARNCFERTEAILKQKSMPLPFPQPKNLPWGVSTVQQPIDSAGGMWRTGAACKKRAGLAIIASVELKDDGEIWYHVSFSRADKVPSYADTVWVKEHWMGDWWAIQCFVPQEEHVNIHPNCLHLWHSLTGPRPFPRFDTLGSI